MTFTEVLKSVEIPAIKTDAPLLGYIVGDENQISVFIAKGKHFGNVLTRLRNFKQMYRSYNPRGYNQQTNGWDFPSGLLNKIREEFKDLDDRTGDLDIPEPEVVKAITQKQEELAKIPPGKVVLGDKLIVISWTKNCTAQEFQMRLDACKKLKAKFGGRYNAANQTWEIDAKAASDVRHMPTYRAIFGSFTYEGNFPALELKSSITNDELTNKLKAAAEKMVEKMLPSGRMLFKHQKEGVMWLVSRPETTKN